MHRKTSPVPRKKQLASSRPLGAVVRIDEARPEVVNRARSAGIGPGQSIAMADRDESGRTSPNDARRVRDVPYRTDVTCHMELM